MLAILVYDVNEKRVKKIHDICSSYLYWKQNSVFVGKIGKFGLRRLEEELKEELNFFEDNVLIFLFPSNVKFKTVSLGLMKNEHEKIFW